MKGNHQGIDDADFKGKRKKVEKEQGQKRIEKISTDWETKTNKNIYPKMHTHFQVCKILGKSLIWIHSSTNTSHPKKELLCFNCQKKSNC